MMTPLNTMKSKLSVMKKHNYAPRANHKQQQVAQRLIGLWLITAIVLSVVGSKNQNNIVTAGFSNGQLFLSIIAVLLFLQLCFDGIVFSHHLNILKKWGTADAEEYIKNGPAKQFWNKFMGLVPLNREKELLIEGHEIDGIEELDNTMPPWLFWLFNGTIICAVIYILYYIILGVGQDQIQEYEKEMAQAKLKKEERLKSQANQIDENTVVLLSSASELNEGKQIFADNCVTCHGPQAGGSVGPNLTDEYWIHGGGVKNVFSTIKYGVVEKGMIAWKEKLSPYQIQEVASFILSLQGSNPEGGLAPVGEKWVD